MLLDERRERILKLIENKGFIALAEIVAEVGTSESTVRRDLEYLDGIGQIRRTRGGAAYVGDSLTTFEERRTRALRQKQTIARAAAELIQPGEAVLLDGGTTTLEVARALIGKSLQVVTNSIPIVSLLINQPNIELMVIGGYVYPKTGVALGPNAVNALKNLHVRQLFVSAGGITADGLYNSNALLVETERQMIESAEEVVVVSDSGKLGHSALAHLCSLDVVDRFVVDSGISSEWQDVFRKAGVELTIVDV
jgi:DeoR/GlpR family transcriptional regulator of sugar metabolism